MYRGIWGQGRENNKYGKIGDKCDEYISSQKCENQINQYYDKEEINLSDETRTDKINFAINRNLLIGYASWDQCDQKIIDSVENGKLKDILFHDFFLVFKIQSICFYFTFFLQVLKYFLILYNYDWTE